MTYDEVVSHFGSAAAAARALGYRHRQRVHKWKDMDAIPLGDQALIEIVTRRKLRADLPVSFRERATA